MPMYEFICAECESDFEKIVPSADVAGDVECPACASRKVHKKLSLFGVGSAKASYNPGSSYTGGFSGGGGCCGGICSGH
ncbi:MAG: zinc ribbon domain-containing protein [Nitrospinota bacterium]